jgi:hypothetical protein
LVLVHRRTPTDCTSRGLAGGAPLAVRIRSLPDSRDPACAVDWFGSGKGRVVVLTDLPAFGRPVRLAWHKSGYPRPHADCPHQ